MKTMIKTVGKVSVLAMSVAAASTALAGELDQLFFTQDTGWQDPLVSFDTSSGNAFHGFDNATGGDAPDDTYADMSWSGIDDDIRSSINLTGFDSHGVNETAGQFTGDFPDLIADIDGEWNSGDWWVISTLTQTNNSLGVSSTPVPNPLWIANTLSNFRIWEDEAQVLPALKEDLDSMLEIDFYETLNATGCPREDSPNPLGTTCDDIYIVAASDFSDITFANDGFVYSVAFNLVPGPSTDADGEVVGASLVCPNEFDPRCDDLGIPEGEIWVFTPEYNPGTSSLSIVASWSAVQIPEPAVLGMFGIGILGMGLAGRRRKQQQA